MCVNVFVCSGNVCISFKNLTLSDLYTEYIFELVFIYISGSIV